MANQSEPTKLPDFKAFRAFVVKDLYGHAAIPKILKWAEKMEEWAKERVEESVRIEQLKQQVASYEEELSKAAWHEELALVAADVKRGIRDLDELMELVE